MTTSIYGVYVFEFLLGLTFAGRVVVGLCYVMEFNMESWYDTIVFWFLIQYEVALLVITVWY